MSPIAQRVADAIHHNAPRVLCFSCLAAQEHLQEHDLRAVALVLMVRAGVRVVRRACSSCGHVDDLLSTQNVT